MQIEVTKEQARILSDILLEEMQKISNMKTNKFIDMNLINGYSSQVEDLFHQATEIGFSEGE